MLGGRTAKAGCIPGSFGTPSFFHPQADIQAFPWPWRGFELEASGGRFASQADSLPRALGSARSAASKVQAVRRLTHFLGDSRRPQPRAISRRAPGTAWGTGVPAPESAGNRAMGKSRAGWEIPRAPPNQGPHAARPRQISSGFPCQAISTLAFKKCLRGQTGKCLRVCAWHPPRVACIEMQCAPRMQECLAKGSPGLRV